MAIENKRKHIGGIFQEQHSKERYLLTCVLTDLIILVSFYSQALYIIDKFNLVQDRVWREQMSS